MLKTRLTSAYYDVVQLSRVSEVAVLLTETRPDLILAATSLPDGNATTLRNMLRNQERTATIPVIAIAPMGDQGARMAALASGVDDVLSQPLDTPFLLARIRSLIRTRQGEDDLRMREGTSHALGFAEPTTVFKAPSEISIIASDKVTAQRRATALRTQIPDRVTAYAKRDLHLAMSQTPSPDALVIDLSTEDSDQRTSGLRMLAEFRARSATRHAALLVVCAADAAHLASDALDMGADDVLPTGFNVNELTLRLAQQVRHKRRSDRLRARVRQGLRAAVIDPMTGLYNRRYAMPFLDRVAQEAQVTKTPYAVMLADLDHFKPINDRLGHAVGDAVLVEIARRLKSNVGAGDMVARVGGEEFLVVLSGAPPETAQRAAKAFCRLIGDHPVEIGRGRPPVQTTISIGLLCGPGPDLTANGSAAQHLIALADKALYRAKDAGRNQVKLSISAA